MDNLFLIRNYLMNQYIKNNVHCIRFLTHKSLSFADIMIYTSNCRTFNLQNCRIFHYLSFLLYAISVSRFGNYNSTYAALAQKSFCVYKFDEYRTPYLTTFFPFFLYKQIIYNRNQKSKLWYNLKFTCNSNEKPKGAIGVLGKC